MKPLSDTSKILLTDFTQNHHLFYYNIHMKSSFKLEDLYQMNHFGELCYVP